MFHCFRMVTVRDRYLLVDSDNEDTKSRHLGYFVEHPWY